MAVNTGDLKNRKQSTAKIWFKRSGGQYTDLGDVAKYKKADDKGYSDIKASQKGYKRMTAKLLANLGLMWNFTLNEQLSEIMKLLGLATQGTDAVQSAGTAGSTAFTSVVLGATYFLPKQDVKNVAITGKVENVDFTVDLGSGAITILATGTIAAGATVTVLHEWNAVTYTPFTSIKETRVTGTF